MDIDFYTNNELVLTRNEICIIENHFKNNLEKDWVDFSKPIMNILEKSIPVMEYYKQQFINSTGLQGGKILELVIGDTLNKIFNTSYMGNNVFLNKQYQIILTGEGGKGTGGVYDIEIIDKVNNIKYIGEIKFCNIESSPYN